MDELPSKLRMELAIAIHYTMYSTVSFFRGKEKSFIAWISKHIRPMHIDEDDFIYKEGEEILEIYFLVKGQAGYVLPRFENKLYFEITQGSLFGHVDLGDNPDYYEDAEVSVLSPNNIRRKRVDRHFTTVAVTNCELLAVGVAEIQQMRLQFPETFAEIFNDVREHLKEHLLLKLEVTKLLELSITKKHSMTADL